MTANKWHCTVIYALSHRIGKDSKESHLRAIDTQINTSLPTSTQWHLRLPYLAFLDSGTRIPGCVIKTVKRAYLWRPWFDLFCSDIDAHSEYFMSCIWSTKLNGHANFCWIEIKVYGVLICWRIHVICLSLWNKMLWAFPKCDDERESLKIQWLRKCPLHMHPRNVCTASTVSKYSCSASRIYAIGAASPFLTFCISIVPMPDWPTSQWVTKDFVKV